jgi:hypothetical protein
MRRVLLSAAALAVVALTPDQGYAQLLGVTVCGKTVGVGFGSSPAGYGYGYGAAPSYGAGHCCPVGFGHGYGMPAYGVSYGMPTYGGSCYGTPGYGYGAATYGASCYGGYGAQTYGSSCTGGHAGYGMGGPNYGVGNPQGAGPVQVWPSWQNRLLPPVDVSSQADPPGAGRDEFKTVLAEIDRIQAGVPAPAVAARRSANDAKQTDETWQALLASVDRINNTTTAWRDPNPPGRRTIGATGR